MPGRLLFSDKNLRGEFFKTYDAAEAGAFASRISMSVDSDQETENYKFLGQAPMMREWVGGRHERPLRPYTYSITNRLFEATLSIDSDDVRRDRMGQIMQRTREMAARAATFWDKILSTLIINTAGALCYDGQLFFDTDHSSGDSGTIKNLVTETEIPSADVVLETAPTVAEMANIILEIISHMYTFKDDTGEPLNQNAKSFTVMVPTKTTFMAATIGALNNAFLTSGAVNPLMASDFKVDMIANPRLTWTKDIAVFRSDGQMAPFILQTEVPVTAALKDDVFDNRRWLFGISCLREVGFGMWQGACKCTLDTAS